MNPEPGYSTNEQLIASAKEAAEPFYDGRLVYHNWQHALATYEECGQLAYGCELMGLQVDRQVIMSAALFHDAGYAYWWGPHIYPTREDYAAGIAEHCLEKIAMPSEQIEHTKSAILSTRVGIPCASLEAKIVRRADLANLAGDFPTFLHANLLLRREHFDLTGEVVDFKEWAERSHDILSNYLDEDLSLGDFDLNESGICRFNAAAQNNVQHLMDTDLRVLIEMHGLSDLLKLSEE